MGAEVKGEKGIRTRGKKEEEPKIREWSQECTAGVEMMLLKGGCGVKKSWGRKRRKKMERKDAGDVDDDAEPKDLKDRQDVRQDHKKKKERTKEHGRV